MFICDLSLRRIQGHTLAIDYNCEYIYTAWYMSIYCAPLYRRARYTTLQKCLPMHYGPADATRTLFGILRVPRALWACRSIHWGIPWCISLPCLKDVMWTAPYAEYTLYDPDVPWSGWHLCAVCTHNLTMSCAVTAQAHDIVTVSCMYGRPNGIAPDRGSARMWPICRYDSRHSDKSSNT